MASRPARTPSTLNAYVLHRYDWSETSLILDLFTREQGRLAVAAKGAKRPYSQLRSVLLPFQRLSVGVGRVKTVSDEQSAPEVQNLRSAEWAGGTTMLERFDIGDDEKRYSVVKVGPAGTVTIK